MFIFIAVLLVGGFIISALPEEVCKKAIKNFRKKK